MPDAHAAEYSMQDRVSPKEWAERVDLAALYRLCARHGMTDLTYTHLSARVPGTKMCSSSIPMASCSSR